MLIVLPSRSMVPVTVSPAARPGGTESACSRRPLRETRRHHAAVTKRFAWSPARPSTGCVRPPRGVRSTSGRWLPEPLLTTPDVADDVELAEGVSIAMLTVLGTLTPTERAVFVLREVFGTPYYEIAELVGAEGWVNEPASHEGRKSGSERLCLDLVELRLSDRSAVE